MDYYNPQQAYIEPIKIKVKKVSNVYQLRKRYVELIQENFNDYSNYQKNIINVSAYSLRAGELKDLANRGDIFDKLEAVNVYVSGLTGEERKNLTRIIKQATKGNKVLTNAVNKAYGIIMRHVPEITDTYSFSTASEVYQVYNRTTDSKERLNIALDKSTGRALDEDEQRRLILDIEEQPTFNKNTKRLERRRRRIFTNEVIEQLIKRSREEF